MFQWYRDNVLLGVSDRYHFSKDKSTLVISPVKKEDMGSYRCVASNPVSQESCRKASELIVYCEWAFSLIGFNLCHSLTVDHARVSRWLEIEFSRTHLYPP